MSTTMMKLVSLSFLIVACSVSQTHALFGFGDAENCVAPCVPGEESIMAQKEHGSSHTPVQQDLRWDCDWNTSDRICNYNRHYAERAGYWETTEFLPSVDTAANEPVAFYDSNSGRKLFTSPVDRTWQDFLAESRNHGWPSFRDSEVNWDYVRVLPNGETVSIDGTHLGHNLPDRKGNRYCINLVSIAGNPAERFHRRNKK